MATTITAPPGYVWVYDQRHDHWGTALTFRIHRMGRCVEAKDAAPYVPTAQRQAYEGDLSDFICTFCRRRYVLLAVASEQEALAFQREATRGRSVIERFEVVPVRGGCDCMSGHEHQLRGCKRVLEFGEGGARPSVPLRLMSVGDLAKERDAKDSSMYEDALAEAAPAEVTAPVLPPAPVASEVTYEVSLPLPTFERAVKSLDNQYLEDEL